MMPWRRAHDLSGAREKATNQCPKAKVDLHLAAATHPAGSLGGGVMIAQFNPAMLIHPTANFRSSKQNLGAAMFVLVDQFIHVS
jgi:hypothetical protein